jgi:hypothetical protein
MCLTHRTNVLSALRHRVLGLSVTRSNNKTPFKPYLPAWPGNDGPQQPTGYVYVYDAVGGSRPLGSPPPPHRILSKALSSATIADKQSFATRASFPGSGAFRGEGHRRQKQIQRLASRARTSSALSRPDPTLARPMAMIAHPSEGGRPTPRLFIRAADIGSLF